MQERIFEVDRPIQANTLPTLEDWPRVLDMAFALIDAAALLDDDPTEKRPVVRKGDSHGKI